MNIYKTEFQAENRVLLIWNMFAMTEPVPIPSIA